MRRGILTSLAVLSLWGGVGLNFAAAQFGGLGQAPIRPRPTVSPFINLGQGGASAYYGIIQPQINANRSIADLQQGIGLLNPDGSLRGQIDSQSTSALGGLQTGHSATFFNYGHYYPQAPPGGATNSSPAGFGPGLGGFSPGMTGGGVGMGGARPFFGNNLAVPLIRP